MGTASGFPLTVQVHIQGHQPEIQGVVCLRVFPSTWKSGVGTGSVWGKSSGQTGTE